MADKIAELSKFYENETIVFGNHPSLIADYMPTGIDVLDAFLDGGLKRNAMSVFAGQEGQGKTWTAQQFAKTQIALGNRVIYLNVEKAYDPAWWKQVGVPIAKLEVANPKTGEEAIDIAQLCCKDEYDVVIIDSLAAMVPEAELDATADGNPMGLHPRMMSKLCRKINQVNKKTHVMMINQVREKVGVVFGNPMFIPGGRALKHYPSTILVCQKNGWIGKKEDRKGFNLRYDCWKQRGTANEGDSVEIPLLFSGRIDQVKTILATAQSFGIIRQRGAFFDIVEKSTGEIKETIQGRQTLAERLENDEELYKMVVDQIPDGPE